MRAIVLAAGRGERMASATERRPKCLIDVAGKPLLDWQCAAIREAGIAAIGVVCGYMSPMIEKDRGIEKFENPRWAQTNMVSSLACARSWLGETPCVVSYADIVYPADTVRRLASAPGDIAIAYDVNWLDLWSLRFADPLEDAETFRIDDSGVLLEIGDRARTIDEIQGQYMGLLKFTPAGWAHVENYLGTVSPADADRLDMTGLLRRVIHAGTTVQTVPIEGRWFEFDSERDLRLYETLQSGGAQPWLLPAVDSHGR